jgi:hypothetical protein
MRNRLLLIVSGLTFVCLLAACTPATPLPPTLTPTPLGEVLFQDDFSDPNSGWDQYNGMLGLTDYANGAYRIAVNEAGRLFWANPGQEFTDVSIEVTAQKVSGGDQNSYGVICRYQSTDSFYALTIGSDGTYGIRKREQAGVAPIFIGNPFQETSPVIQTGEATNTIRADCIGNTISLYVNGELLVQVEDAGNLSGDVGLFVGTFSASTTEVLFDNFVVRTP